MSEIEKMYKNADVEHGSCQNYSRFEQCCNSLFCDSGMCPNGISGEKHPFTAEKQIELIKLLGNVRDYTVEIDKFKGVYYVGCRSAESNDKLWGSSNVFEDALAELINETWFCLTPEEKQQVKGILE